MAHKAYIKEVENSDTVVLFIHGFLGSPEHFQKFIELIPENISIYNVLLAGHGGSVMDFGKASMSKWKKQISDITYNLSEKYEKIYIVAHSMGTFFAMNEAIKYPDKVKAIFLLQTPLKIGVRREALFNTVKSFFNTFSDDDVATAYKNAHSVALNFRIWEYLTWLPRYIELFKESKSARNVILSLKTPCMIFQSAKDELVSMKSLDFIPQKDNIHISVLKKSAHFIYDKEEEKFLHRMFRQMFL